MSSLAGLSSIFPLRSLNLSIAALVAKTYSTLGAQVAAILKKYGTDAHVYLPGIGVINGLTAGNYLDSAGTTAATVDNPVGLALDGAGSVGAELVTNGDFSSATGWTLGANVSISGGTLNVTGAAASIFAAQPITVSAGKSYRVTYTVISNNGQFSANVGGTSGIALNAGQTGTISEIIVATNGNASGFINRGSGVSSAVIDNISVKEVTGIHATQATTANKPILRRGAVNILLNSILAGGTSGTLGSGAVAPTSYTFAVNTGQVVFASNTVQFIAATQRPFLNQQFSIITTTYTVQAKVDLVTSGSITAAGILQPNAGTAVIGAVTYSANGVGVASSYVPVAGDVIAATFTCTTAGTLNIRLGLGCVANATGDITMSQFQLEVGSTASTYAPTTTAPASNLVGNYAWQFDGSNDSLALGSVPFRMTDDHCVIAGAKASAAATVRTLYSQRNTASTTAIVANLALSTTNNIRGVWRDDLNIAASVSGDTVTSNEVFVASLRKTGNLKQVGKNGAFHANTSSTVQGATTLNTATIGASITTTTAETFDNNIYPEIVIKGTVTDADHLILSKFVGLMSGVTI